MTPAFRKLNLTVHITSSVGWIGAVASFLVLSIAGLTSHDVALVHSVYLAMNLIDLYIIIPLCFIALATGIIQSLGTEWGLRRYYWLVIKLVLTIGSTLLLLLHQFTAVAGTAKIASETDTGTLPNVGMMGTQLVGDASLAILVLLMLTVLSVYKPWGLTRYGRRNKAPQLSDNKTPLGLNIFFGVCGVIALTGFVLSHLIGHSHHGL